MSVLIAASAVRTCLGDSGQTFAALLAGRDGLAPLRYADPQALNVHYGYHMPEPNGAEPALRASGWLADCMATAVRRSGLDRGRHRVAAVVGTGLRELRAVERWALDDADLALEQLHFGAVVRGATGIDGGTTVSNACSAGGYALALAQDMLELDEADAVVVGGADAMTESMLAMIGRVVDRPTDRVRPFDVGRTGVLLGEGAAAMVLVRDPELATRPSRSAARTAGWRCTGSARPCPRSPTAWSWCRSGIRTRRPNGRSACAAPRCTTSR